MANNVTQAFNEFLANAVRLDTGRSDTAKSSRDYLKGQILKFPDDKDFPEIHPDGVIDYGSFARKTKIRPLDDIDMMVIMHGQSGTYNEFYDKIEITVHPDARTLVSLCNANSVILNSRKVIEKFKASLGNITVYGKADIKRNMEAATLKLDSYEWIFDIVPCFLTTADATGKSFYLIPDGNGNWKKSDPRFDKERMRSTNALQNVSVLDMIRLFKYWTGRATMPTIKSYFLENLILNYYNSGVTSSTYVDYEIPNVLAYIYNNIHNALNDPKGFQGDINHLTWDEREKIKNKAAKDYHIAKAAIEFETNKNMRESINKWREIFGESFPQYA
ncbi:MULTISPECIES: nucleotidyltransferase [unclassified Pedobacter]|uniref:nucleotidyltransferase n=1 Tax=unclassified Pedobacter TaxID=2628915 RepID=UPI00141E4C6B|nr:MULTISPECIES: nucleotidyltransferase [unclassified Pedobacter]NII82741.1 hypothetical protein [Pedobacter sp. SG908]NMN36759.1 hypothetical protein [Pedobacter sp. SG918]